MLSEIGSATREKRNHRCSAGDSFCPSGALDLILAFPTVCVSQEAGGGESVCISQFSMIACINMHDL